jgi:hypothetical protein
MCPHDHLHREGLSRRNFGTLAFAAAGIGLLPLAARAAGTAEALAVTCIDYRFTGDAAQLLDSLHLAKQYDLVSLAGASLAAVSPKFPSSNAAFWDQLALAKSLHDVKKLIILDHRDCGAYKAAFGDKYAGEGAAETAQHKGVMLDVKAKLAEKYPALGFEAYLLALDGSSIKVV